MKIFTNKKRYQIGTSIVFFFHKMPPIMIKQGNIFIRAHSIKVGCLQQSVVLGGTPILIYWINKEIIDLNIARVLKDLYFFLTK